MVRVGQIWGRAQMEDGREFLVRVNIEGAWRHNPALGRCSTELAALRAKVIKIDALFPRVAPLGSGATLGFGTQPR